MGKRLLIAEKPSVAKSFAEALGVHSSEKHDGYIEDNKWIITWCLGHLITLSFPEKYDLEMKYWNLNKLPFLPEKYKYQVIEESGAKKQFKIVSNLLNRLDLDIIYNAGDSGREGEYIQRLVYTAAGIEGKKEIKRVWIDSQTREEIIRGIGEAEPEKKYENLYYAGVERAIEDYCVGINLSRAFTCKFGYELTQKYKKKKNIVVAVGRVMTCVQGMVVEREAEINNFMETSYFKISADHGGFVSRWKSIEESSFFNNPKLYNETGFKDEEDANSLIQDMSSFPFLEVITSEKKKENKNAPLLFNLAELQAECTKRYKISPDETLVIVQSLYEKKLTTYPRTDARVLSTPVAKEIQKNITGLKFTLPQMEEFIDEILRNNKWKEITNTRYTDDSKITDHYAIIPTGQGKTDGLTDMELTIYILIVRRFLAIFCEPAVYEKYDVTLKHKNGEFFFASKKFLLSNGYLKIYEKSEEEKSKEDEQEDPVTNMLRLIKIGNVIPADFTCEKASTVPPKRYTSGSMILAMEHAGKLIEDEELRAQIKECGIGTSATRAEVIKKLVSLEYLKLDKKTQILYPTELGDDIIERVKKCTKEMLSPEFTASWEKGLSQIEKGAISPVSYRKKMEEWVSSAVETVKKQEAEKAPEKKMIEKVEVGKCPACGAKLLYAKEYGYFCEKKRKDKKTCQFFVGHKIAGRKMTKEEIMPLLRGEPTAYFSDFLSKEKKTFTARLVLKKGGLVAFESKSEISSFVCPKCGKKFRQTEFRYTCACGFSVPVKMASRRFSQEEINTLANLGRLNNLEGFMSKKGKNFSANIIYENGECKFEF